VIPKETALAGVVSTRNNLLAVSGFGLILLVGVVFVGTRRITRPIEALSNKAAAIEEGNYDIDIESDRRDEVGDLYGSLSSMRDSLVSKVQESEEASRRAQSAKEEAETARTEAEQLNKHLQQKASEFSRVMESAADGDLTRRMDPDSESPAMSQIAESYNGMMSDIEEAFAEISSFAEEVDRMTAEVSSSTQEGKEASEQVGSSIQEISADAEKQSESLHQVFSEVQNLSGSIEEVAASADQIATSSQEMAEIGSKSQRSASDAIEEMSAIEEKSDQTIGEMKTLADEIEEIVNRSPLAL
jgi:methyl-accepting chemotaxis protein